MLFFRARKFSLNHGEVCYVQYHGRKLEQKFSDLLDAVRLRNELQSPAGRRTEIGVITNGTLINHYREALFRFLLICVQYTVKPAAAQ